MDWQILQFQTEVHKHPFLLTPMLELMAPLHVVRIAMSFLEAARELQLVLVLWQPSRLQFELTLLISPLILRAPELLCS